MKLAVCATDQEQTVFDVQKTIYKTMMDRVVNAAKHVKHVLNLFQNAHHAMTVTF